MSILCSQQMFYFSDSNIEQYNLIANLKIFFFLYLLRLDLDWHVVITFYEDASKSSITLRWSVCFDSNSVCHVKSSDH